VTLPEADELTMVPVLSAPVLDVLQSAQPILMPTRPPAVPLLPLTTLPAANERSILPVFSPTRPPAISHVTAEPTLPDATESLMVPRLVPTNPPTTEGLLSALLDPPPLLVTAPVAKPFSIVPSLLPTSPPDVPDLLPVMLPVAQENDAPIA